MPSFESTEQLKDVFEEFWNRSGIAVRKLKR
jgi:hypothetical protein